MALLLFIAGVSAVGQLDDSVLSDEYPRITREWVDSTGKFRVNAKLISMTETAVVLEKPDKQTVSVPLTRLDKFSQAIAQDAYLHFFVEEKIHDIIEQVMETAAQENSSGNSRELQEQLMARANAELRKLKMRMRYRITDVEKYDPKKAAQTGSDYAIDFVSLQDWRVTPDAWQSDGGLPAIGSYLRGWSFKEKDFDPTAVVANKSVFEMTGVPQLFSIARDFSWRGNGKKNGADRRARVNMTISFALMKHEVRVFTPGR